jgi:hypothetical protein
LLDKPDPLLLRHLPWLVSNPALEWLDEITNGDAVDRNLFQNFRGLDDQT